MQRKDIIFGVNYQRIMAGWNPLNYNEIIVGTPIYIRYVVISIISFTSLLAIELFYLTQLRSSLQFLFEYLPLFIPLQVCGLSLTRFKEFRMFWISYFLDTSVKGTDNF